MQVILTQKVDKLGRKGEVVSVKDGYFRNFLFPRGFAKLPNKGLMAWAEKMKEQAMLEKEQIAAQAEEIKKKLESASLVLERKTTKKDTLYGSISEKDIIELLADKAKLELEKKQIKMNEPIKSVGKHKVSVQLSDDISVDIEVEVKALS